MVNGGEELSTYPGSCHLPIELRAVPSQDVELTTREIESPLAKIVEKQPQFTFKCPRVLFSRSAYPLDALLAFGHTSSQKRLWAIRGAYMTPIVVRYSVTRYKWGSKSPLRTDRPRPSW